MKDLQGRPRPRTLTHEVEGDILVVYQNGVNDPDRIMAGMQAALADPALQPGTHLLWVAIDAPATATPEKMQRLLAWVGGQGGKLTRRCALVVATDLQFGVSRMFSVFSEERGLDVNVFYDLDEARAWLRHEEDAAG